MATTLTASVTAPLPRAPLALLALTLTLALAGCGSAAAVPPLPAPSGPSVTGGAPGAQRGAANGQDPADDPREATVAALLNATLGVLQQNRDEEAAAVAILPYLHRSLLDASGSRLTTDVRSFSFKKAHGAAALYANPVKITRMRASTITAIGLGPTAERGRLVDYFVAKRDGVAGMPAPVTVFFPASGGPPTVSYLGSL